MSINVYYQEDAKHDRLHIGEARNMAHARVIAKRNQRRNIERSILCYTWESKSEGQLYEATDADTND